MKKSYIYIIVLILILMSVYFFKNKSKTFVVNGIKYSVSVDRVTSDSFPDKGSYDVLMKCSNANSNWNYEEWTAEVYDITGEVSCSIFFSSKPKTTMADYIINLLGVNTNIASESTTGNGSTLEKITDNGEADYRYRGKNPANYIRFNNELWRIIGVFDENTHGITGTNLVKIIRNDSIGSYVWDSYGTLGANNFADSDIYQILNTAYYNAIDGTGEDYCRAAYNSNGVYFSGKCDFTSIGIQEEYRNMIEISAIWHLGGGISNGSRAGEYSNERDSTIAYGSNDGSVGGSTNSVPIGLMYVSDYGYAAPSTCPNNFSLYNESGCADSDWLLSNYCEWTITPSSGSSYGVFATGFKNAGTLTNNNSNSSYSVRPVLYLDSSVFYLSGTGTQTNPYIIGV